MINEAVSRVDSLTTSILLIAHGKYVGIPDESFQIPAILCNIVKG
jgi:hypothetical protein